MDAANLHKGTREAGVLVLQTGRQAGARRPLGAPTTFVGRGPGCDIRLNVEGVDALHCLIVCTPDGVQLRDIDSAEGTYVNGTRTEKTLLQDGDILKVGPFQFRLELIADPLADDTRALEEIRDGLRIQAAAIAAQQAALEEEEARLEQRRSNLKEQEEQLAAHLEERQRQVQVWADFTKNEREALHKEKIEQDQHLARLEKELWEAKEAVAKQEQDVAKSRVRIDKVYQRLRQRWQRQWVGEREKHQRLVAELAADRTALQERERAQQTREAAFKDEVVQSNTERELAQRQLRAERETLQKDQEAWRRRRSHEHLILKSQARKLEETGVKVKQLREVLAEERTAWEKQQELLQKELYGLNNRIIHQRLVVGQQQDEIARLDVALRERRNPVASVGSTDAFGIDAPAEEMTRRCADLDRLAGDLADQRIHLLEQYNRLAAIQADWQRQREQASAELETLARRLIDEEHALAERERHAGAADELLQERLREADALRLDLQVWHAQLKAREQTFGHQHQQEMLALRQHQKLLEEQLSGLAVLRQRWNHRRQQEIDRLQAERAVLAQEQKQTQDRRLVFFEKSQEVEAEKRIVAEKTLALEQYRQEVFTRANDPGGQRRVERLRRRWLSLNSALIRNAKSASEATRKELAELEALRVELTQASARLTQDEATWTDKKAALEEREAALKIRQQQFDLDVRRLQMQQAQDDPEVVAQAIYDEFDQSSKAA